MAQKYEIEPEHLFNLYWIDGLSSESIAQKVGCVRNTILYRMRKYGIPRRQRHCFTKTFTKKLSEFEKGYIAAMIDAEGCLAFSKAGRKRPNKRPYVEVLSNSSLQLVKHVQRMLGNCCRITKKKTPHKLCYYIRLHRALDIVELLTQIEPHLVAKKQKAREILSFLECISLAKIYIPEAAVGIADQEKVK